MSIFQSPFLTSHTSLLGSVDMIAPADSVEEGGGTRFPELNNLTIEPKKGRVLIWPSVRDENPYEEDPRTEHEALEVTKGHKFAANAWIHMRDFQKSLRLDCES